MRNLPLTIRKRYDCGKHSEIAVKEGESNCFSQTVWRRRSNQTSTCFFHLNLWSSFALFIPFHLKSRTKRLRNGKFLQGKRTAPGTLTLHFHHMGFDILVISFSSQVFSLYRYMKDFSGFFNLFSSDLASHCVFRRFDSFVETQLTWKKRKHQRRERESRVMQRKRKAAVISF